MKFGYKNMVSNHVWNIVSNVKVIDKIYMDENRNSWLLKNKYKENLYGRMCIFELKIWNVLNLFKYTYINCWF